MLETFPYTPRTGQEEMTQAMLEATENGKVMLAHAPTGIGKSICSLAAATKTAGIDLDQDEYKILFLTNRRNQARIVLQEARAIGKKIAKTVGCVAIQSRKSLCPLIREQQPKEKLDYSDFIEVCKEAKTSGRCRYWKNMRRTGRREGELWTEEALETARATIGKMPEEAYGYVTSQEMCTYEALKLAAQESQILIARYIHAFDPTIKSYFLEKIFEPEDSITIIDEAHNLGDDIAKHYSIEITERTIDTAAIELQGIRSQKPEAEECLELLNKLRQTMWRLTETEATRETLIRRWDLTCGYHLEELKEKIELLKELGDAIKEQKEEAGQVVTRSYTHSIAEKWETIMKPDRKYILLTYLKETKWKQRYPVVELRCIDARDTISTTLETFHAAILMSATLTPLQYHQDTLGIPEERAVRQEYPPVFPKENRRIIIDVGATSQYSYRDEAMYGTIADYCERIIEATPGPCIFFYPSYGFLKEIVQRLHGYASRVWVEGPQSTIDEFQEQKEHDTILHAVASGKFAEGIDVPDYFKAATSIGVPLATWSEVVKEKIAYYEELYPHRGRLYAYEIPAINKIIQSVGRAIRTPQDRAAMIAIDSRLGKRYRGYLPRYWKDEMIVTADPDQVSDRIGEFWNQWPE